MTSSRSSSDQSGSAVEPSDSQWAAVLLDGWLWAEAALKPEKSEMGVKLEVFRMTIYLTFPVAMFWIANQAGWFEDYVIQRKRELWPPENEDKRQELEEFKERIRKQREEKLLRAAQQRS
nr:protein PET100 homolog, mitochondrial [Delphinus delphis]